MYKYSFEINEYNRIFACDQCPLKRTHTFTRNDYCAHIDGPDECNDITRPANCPLTEERISNES